MRIKAPFSSEVIHTSMPRKLWQSGVWSCIMPRMPTHLVQELHVGTRNVLNRSLQEIVCTVCPRAVDENHALQTTATRSCDYSVFWALMCVYSADI